jgi:RHS repeat-associated protein
LIWVESRAVNATNALFEVCDNTVKETSLGVNQQLVPADWQDIGDNNTLWERLIVFKADSTSASVKLWNTGANGTIVADAVRVREVGTVERTTHNKVGDVTASVDGLGNETISLFDRRGRLTSVYEPLRDPTVTPWRPTPTNNPTSSDWTTVSDSRAYGGSYLRANGSSSSYPTYTMSVPSLSYYPTLAVMATWVPDEENISNALFRVFDNFNNEIGSIYVDQTVAPGDYRDETGRWWAVLGVYQMIPFYTSVKVSPQIGAQADAARLIEVGPRAFKNTYDAAGSLTQVTDAKNNDTYFYRDNLNRVKEEKNELNESRYFEFYANSQLKKATDRNGRVIEHFYDNLGRETEERWKNRGATVRSIAFGYDANSNLTTADDDGTNARDYDWFYDKLGRLTESEFATSSYTWEFKHGHDGNSNRDSRDLLRSGTTQFSDTFVFDDLNRPTSLARDAVNWGHDLRAEFVYNAAGQFDQVKRFNVTTGGTAFVTSHYGYDGMGRLTSLDHTNSSSQSITGYGWTYDAAGRMKSMDFTNSAYNAEDVTTFGYDRTNQLLSGECSGTTNDEAYAYDSAGNRTTANGATYTTTSNNRLTNDGTFTYTYDDEGNRLTRVRISGAAADDKTVEYTWDYRNRLEKVTFKRNDGTVTKTVDLRYDMFNQLTQKVVDPDGALGSAALQTDDYLWDGGELVGVTGYNSLVFASGPAPDMVLFESATTLHALLGDHLNTVRDVIATNGTLENHLVYNSYGELKSQTGGGAYSPFHRFTGKPFDVAIGLQYNINRWYDPATGRWLSEDPIGFGGGHENLNVYTGNSPVVTVDPSGLEPVGLDPAQRAAWRHRRLVEMATRQAYADIYHMVNDPITGHGNDWFDKLSDFAAGWGDTLSMGLTNLIREHAGWNSAVDFDSVSYAAGEWTGAIHAAAIAGAASGSIRSEVTSAVIEQATGVPVSLRPGARSGDVLGQVDSAALRRLELGGAVEVPAGTQGIRQMMSDLSVVSGNEVALVRMDSGRRVLLMGTPDGVNVGPFSQRIIAHTHPKGSLRFSNADIRALQKRGQHSSVIISPREDFGVRLPVPPRIRRS